MGQPMTALGDFGAWVTSRVACGGDFATSAHNVSVLREAKVTIILNLSDKDDAARGIDLGPLYSIWLPTVDDGTPRTDQWFAAGLPILLNAHAMGGQAVYLHDGTNGWNVASSMMHALLQSLGFYDSESAQRIYSALPGATIRYWQDANRAINNLGFVMGAPYVPYVPPA